MTVRNLIVVAAMVLALGTPAWAGDEFILTAGEADAFRVIERHGLVLLDRVPDRDVFLVRGPDGVPSDVVMKRVLADLADLADEDDDDDSDDDTTRNSIELNGVARLPEIGAGVLPGASLADAQATLLDRTEALYHGRRVWARYAVQYASTRVRTPDAHIAYGTGGGTVAVIDSGVDPGHPALVGGLVDGYDFTTDAPGASELGALEAGHPILNPTQVAILDNTAITRMNPWTQALLEPAQAAAIVPGTVPEAFGHGTMVASLVRLVAPGAVIMPLRTFDAAGNGRVFNVVRAMYYAAAHGASVVNMSLSLPGPSRALADAVTVLHEQNVVVVAAVGNDGQAALRYPAALSDVIGVAAVTPGDRRSDFSNFGPEIVTLAAPGEALIAAYPGGQYALAWGTSFATPLVAGAIALMQGVNPGIELDEVRRGLERADPVTGAGLGAGRLNVFRAASDAAGVPTP